MSAIDFENILKNGMWSVDGGALSASMTRKIAEAELTAKVPELCPDCDSTGTVVVERDDDGNPTLGYSGCDHPNAPTIAKLLDMGVAMFTATPAKTSEPHYRSIR
jgi:hypothetical protein